jgi:hypothetical protein
VVLTMMVPFKPKLVGICVREVRRSDGLIDARSLTSNGAIVQPPLINGGSVRLYRAKLRQ